MKMSRKIRVLVVDDSAFIRRALISIFDGHPQIQIVDVAADGEMAVLLVQKQRPDVVTLDIRMPVLDGLSALQIIMRECPTPVIMLSSRAERGGENSIKALELGAVDFIDKSSAGGAMEIAGLARELAEKILVAARVDVHKLQSGGDDNETAASTGTLSITRSTEVVLIGTSTGGPPALLQILGKLPADFPCPILIVQHMPVGFTTSLAERLNRNCALVVKEAAEGERIMAGVAYLAPAGKHMKLIRSGRHLHIRFDLSPGNALHRPSVDALFESAAAACGNNVLAFVLTGMGKDGAEGSQAIKKAGGRIVVESEETSIVFGMPKAVMEKITVDADLPLYDIPEALMKMI